MFALICTIRAVVMPLTLRVDRHCSLHEELGCDAASRVLSGDWADPVLEPHVFRRADTGGALACY